MSGRQYLVDNKFMLRRKNFNKALDAVVEGIKHLRARKPVSTSHMLNDPDCLQEAFEIFGFDPIDNEVGDICAVDALSDEQDANQMLLLFEAIAPFVEPGSYITMVENHQLWQWFFDNGQIYTREVATMGIITGPEDADRRKANKEPEVGYRYCECRDCMEITVGKQGEYCHECIEASCPDYQGQKGMSQECRVDGAYGESEE